MSTVGSRAATPLAGLGGLELDAQHGIEQEALELLVWRLARRRGLDLWGHSPALIRTQVAARMAALRVDNAQEYLNLVDASPNESRALAANLLVGDTRFFRDAEAFSALSDAFLARLATMDMVRAWVVGCSTGEEAYSLATLLLECQERLGVRLQLRIFATDVCEDALVRARRGLYPPSIANRVSPERLERFFVRVDGGFRVRRVLRDAILFAPHNVLRTPPYARLDFVSCRNLLLYLTGPARRIAFERFQFALRPGGMLLLGCAESALAGEDLFATLNAEARLYLRRDGSGAARRRASGVLGWPSANAHAAARSDA